MTRYEFIQRLSGLLAGLPVLDRQRYLESYAELIADKMEDGMTEAQAVDSLGDPAAVATEILGQTPVEPKRKRSAGTIALVALGSPVWLPLILVAAVLVLTVVVTLWAVLVALYAVVLALFVAALACLAAIFLTVSGGSALLCLGAALALTGAGLLGLLGVLALTRGLVWLTRRLCRGVFVRKEAA